MEQVFFWPPPKLIWKDLGLVPSDDFTRLRGYRGRRGIQAGCTGCAAGSPHLEEKLTIYFLYSPNKNVFVPSVVYVLYFSARTVSVKQLQH